MTDHLIFSNSFTYGYEIHGNLSMIVGVKKEGKLSSACVWINLSHIYLRVGPNFNLT